MIPTPPHAPHLLVVDDDDKLRALLTQFLSREGYVVTSAESAAQAREAMGLFAFDLLVLDVMMPGEAGTMLASQLRAHNGPPALLLTAMSEPADRIAGLEAGADDYLTKPFEPRELVLRIRAILSRTRAREASSALRFGPFRFASESGKLEKDGEAIYLTGSELACLRALAAIPGVPLSREALAEAAGEGASNPRSVDVLINRLRKKIEENPARPAYIQTVRHAGYALVLG